MMRGFENWWIVFPAMLLMRAWNCLKSFG